jgi:serine/threonine protein kinase HipA of HipAB toxin-antitoxin module
MQETGGGAKISISIGDARAEKAEQIEVDAMQVYQAQLALREKEIEELRIVNGHLEGSGQENLFWGNLRGSRRFTGIETSRGDADC